MSPRTMKPVSSPLVTEGRRRIVALTAFVEYNHPVGRRSRQLVRLGLATATLSDALDPFSVGAPPREPPILLGDACRFPLRSGLNGAGWVLLASAWREIQRQAEVLYHLTRHDWCLRLYDRPKSPWTEAGDALAALARHDLAGLAMAETVVRPGVMKDARTGLLRAVRPDDDDLVFEDAVNLLLVGLPSDFAEEMAHA